MQGHTHTGKRSPGGGGGGMRALTPYTRAHLCMQYINKLNTKNPIERGEGGGEEREGYLHTFAKIHEYMYF